MCKRKYKKILKKKKDNLKQVRLLADEVRMFRIMLAMGDDEWVQRVDTTVCSEDKIISDIITQRIDKQDGSLYRTDIHLEYTKHEKMVTF